MYIVDNVLLLYIMNIHTQYTIYSVYFIILSGGLYTVCYTTATCFHIHYIRCHYLLITNSSGMFSFLNIFLLSFIIFNINKLYLFKFSTLIKEDSRSLLI